jgi:hypothetical protein
MTITGLNLDNIDETSQEEIEAELVRTLRPRQTLYETSSYMVMLDYRPDFATLHRRAARVMASTPSGTLLNSLGHLYVYINTGWEIGIYNTFRSCQVQGVTRGQLLEVVMAAQVSAGMVGLECVYRAVSGILRDFRDRAEPAQFPAGWAPDMPAFKSGLDLSTQHATAADLEAVNSWYIRTIGEIPKSIAFAAEHDPDFLKAYRAKWEGAFRGALPKQLMPYLMLRYATVCGFRDGIREAAMLCRAWGVTKQHVVHAVIAAAYYKNGMDVIHVAQDALADVFATWR